MELGRSLLRELSKFLRKQLSFLKMRLASKWYSRSVNTTKRIHSDSRHALVRLYD